MTHPKPQGGRGEQRRQRKNEKRKTKIPMSAKLHSEGIIILDGRLSYPHLFFPSGSFFTGMARNKVG